MPCPLRSFFDRRPRYSAMRFYDELGPPAPVQPVAAKPAQEPLLLDVPAPSFKASDLHVISVISNPMRFSKRSQLFRDFLARQAKSGVTQWVVEATYGERNPEIVCHPAERTIRVRCDHEIWLKENLINVGARFLPKDAKYIAWVDGDISFDNPNWAVEVIEALQHYTVVQPFDTAYDLGPDGEVMQTHKSFCYCYVEGSKLGPNNKLGGWAYGGPYWHSGYAFAWRADAWSKVGGMIERGICGAGDYHMACALIGQGAFSRPGNSHPNYRHMVDVWEAAAEAVVKRNIGYVPGSIKHYYHGSKEMRKYIERWDIVTKNDFDPFRDMVSDRHGVLRLAPTVSRRMWNLRDQLRQYFSDRREDD